MATARDVARAAGTSTAAVSAVFNHNGRHNIRVGAVTRERILAAAAELGFTPNPLARSLATGRTGVLGLVFPYSRAFLDRNPFCDRVLGGVLDEAVRQGVNLMLHTAAGERWHEADAASLVNARVDGLILVLPAPDSPVIERCIATDFPCVALVSDRGRDATCAINADEFSGGRLATEHLLRLGHARIAHLVGTPGVGSTEPRREGYLAALRAAGVEPDPALVVPAGFSRKGGHAAMEALLERPPGSRPTAVFAANDQCAMGAMDALREHGLAVPDDVAVVGYDDTWLAASAQPPLTSVHMPIYEMAVLAVQKLIARVEKREAAEGEVVLPVSLTVRQSCGAMKPADASEEEKQP